MPHPSLAAPAVQQCHRRFQRCRCSTAAAAIPLRCSRSCITDSHSGSQGFGQDSSQSGSAPSCGNLGAPLASLLAIGQAAEGHGD